MLDAVPDLRKALKTATEEQLAEVFGAFDVTITYDKTSQQLNLGATITRTCDLRVMRSPRPGWLGPGGPVLLGFGVPVAPQIRSYWNDGRPARWAKVEHRPPPIGALRAAIEDDANP